MASYVVNFFQVNLGEMKGRMNEEEVWAWADEDWWIAWKRCDQRRIDCMMGKVLNER
jgi:hypothetical protein